MLSLRHKKESIMLRRVILAAVVAVVAYLVCIFVGGLLVALDVPVVAALGSFLKSFASVISVLVFLWYAFVGTLPF